MFQKNRIFDRKYCKNSIKIFLTAIPIIAASPNADALGIVSRSCAAVGAQESISVDWSFQKFTLWTASTHYRAGVLLHTINSVATNPAQNGWEHTWRSYAGHIGSEFFYGTVIGSHWKSDSGLFSMIGESTATDCNLSQWGAS